MKILKAPIRVLQYIFFLGSGSLICNHELYSQPFAVGTRLIDGNFQCLSLNDLGLFLQRRIRATANTTGATWEFPKTCAYPGDVWRPYVPGTPPVPFNTIMDPATAPNSARFNAANGGASGTFAPGTAGRYYTFNVEDKVGTFNVFMAVLETPYDPVQLTGVVQNPAIVGEQMTVNLTMNTAAPLSPGEFVYLRYTTDSFQTSRISQVSMTGTTGRASIPGHPAGARLIYYFYSSNKTLSEINAAVAQYGQVAHDMFALNLLNNGGPNYAYTVLPSSRVINFCGRMVNGTTRLNWTTSREVQLERFTIQRSTDSVNFSNAGNVNSAAPGGNSSSPLFYRAEDPANAPVVFYRLMLTHRNGLITYSDVIKVKQSKGNNEIIDAGPNPARQFINITLTGCNCEYAVLVRDMLGRTVLRFDNLPQGQHRIDVMKLAKGAYILEAFNLTEKTRWTNRFVKN